LVILAYYRRKKTYHKKKVISFQLLCRAPPAKSSRGRICEAFRLVNKYHLFTPIILRERMSTTARKSTLTFEHPIRASSAARRLFAFRRNTPAGFVRPRGRTFPAGVDPCTRAPGADHLPQRDEFTRASGPRSGPQEAGPKGSRTRQRARERSTCRRRWREPAACPGEERPAETGGAEARSQVGKRFGPDVDKTFGQSRRAHRQCERRVLDAGLGHLERRDQGKGPQNPATPE